MRLGLILVASGVLAAIFVDALPVQVLFDPRVGADTLIGSLVVGGWGLLTVGLDVLPRSLFGFGLSLVVLLYYVGIVAVVTSVLSIVRTD